MCDQTEINYAEGDVVWVKLRSYWWPGQVVDLNKLSDDIQNEFKKKPLIAVVKFFQEDSFEFVKNHQQIFKYDCAQKDDFIKKGLDKYRIKNKDGSNFMEKFPGDVKIAETLTGGNPEILSDPKFSPEQKPDISGLFGEKKIPKKRRTRDDSFKKNVKVKVVHPRFFKENDHEIRIRQQLNSLSSNLSQNSINEVYPCYICGFTSTRVNVTICHLKNHILNKDTNVAKLKQRVDLKLKRVSTGTPKKRNTKKSTPDKNTKEDVKVDLGKRKHPQNNDDSNKKKKSDPELREKLLADWNEDSDEDDSLNSKVLLETDASKNDQLHDDLTNNSDFSKNESKESHSDSYELLQKSNTLLQETKNLLEFPTSINISNKFEKSFESSGKSDTLLFKNDKEFFPSKKLKGKKSISETEEKRPQLSCFDFDEEDIVDSSISSVKKLPRSVGCKNMSIKKEIIKEFEKSQAFQKEVIKRTKSSEKLDENLSESDKRETISEDDIEIERFDVKNIKKKESCKKIVQAADACKPNEETAANLDVEVPKVNVEDPQQNRELKTINFDSIEDTHTPTKPIQKEEKKFNDEKNVCRDNETKKLCEDKNLHDQKDDDNNFQQKDTSVTCNSLILESSKTNDKICREKDLEKSIETEKKFSEVTSFDDDCPSSTAPVSSNQNLNLKSSPKKKKIDESGNKIDNLEQNKEMKCDHKRVLPSSENNENFNIDCSSDTFINTYDDKEFQSKVLELEDFNEHKLKKDDYLSDSDSVEKIRNSTSLLNSNDVKHNEDVVVKDVFEKSSNAQINNDKDEGCKKSFDEQNDVKQSSNVCHNNEKNLFSNETKSEISENLKIVANDSQTEKMNEQSCDEIVETNILAKENPVNKSTDGQQEILIKESSEIDPVLTQNSGEKVKQNIVTECSNVILKDSKAFKEESDILSNNPQNPKSNSKNDDSSNKINDKNLSSNTETNFEKNLSLNSNESFVTRKPVSNEEAVVITNVIPAVLENTTKNEQSKPTELISETKVVQVKQREKPRIIENVTLKKPMILKTKFVDKRGGKISKQRIGSNYLKLDESKSKNILKTKAVKIVKYSKNVPQIVNSPSSQLIGKETEVYTSVHQVPSVLSHTSPNALDVKSNTRGSENYVNTELDIQSMPFVFSEDLSPESIEQMPVVISPILPTVSQNTVALSQTLTSPKEKINKGQVFETSKEINLSGIKKRTDTPTILKNKSKAKPMITSIKTIIPPLTSKVHKGGYKINVQPLTSSCSQKSPGKYIIVQSSGQHISTNQKIITPASKNSSNAQIVKQGNKVVILPPTQTGQTMVPINSLCKVVNTENVKKLVRTKPINKIKNLNLQRSGVTLATKTEKISSSPSSCQFINQKMTTQNQTSPKIISTQSLENKPSSITNPSKNILLKESVTVPVNTSIFGGKNMNLKSTPTKETESKNIGFAKDISALISSSSTDHVIVNPQSIISKGTVLTPITGSQVRAIAAKNIKGNKCEPKQNKILVSGKQIKPNIMKSPGNTKNTPTSNLSINVSGNTLTSKQTSVGNINKNNKNVVPESPLCGMKMKPELHSKNIINEEIGHATKNIHHSPSNEAIGTNSGCFKSNKLTSIKEHLPKKATKLQSEQKISATQSTKCSKKIDESTLTISSDLNPVPSLISPFTAETVTDNVIKKDTFGDISLNNETVSNVQSIIPSDADKSNDLQISSQTQIMVLPTECTDETQTYVFVTVNDQGHIIPLDDNSALLANDSLCETRNIDNIILQIDESNLLSNSTQEVKTLQSAEITQNQDILAAALANTDFHQEVSAVETLTSNSLTTFSETSLINQTILQSTIIPPTEPISSPLVLETSLTLNQPIMTPLEIPSNLHCQSEQTATSSISPTLALSTIDCSQEVAYSLDEKSMIQNSKYSVSKLKENEHESSTTETNKNKTSSDGCINITSKNDYKTSDEIKQKCYKNSAMKENDESPNTASEHVVSTDLTEKKMSIFTDTSDEYILSSHNAISSEESEHFAANAKIVKLETSEIVIDQPEQKNDSYISPEISANKNNSHKSQTLEDANNREELDLKLNMLNDYQKSDRTLVDEFDETTKNSSTSFSDDTKGQICLEYGNEDLSKINTSVQSFRNVLSESNEMKTISENLSESHFLSQNYEVVKEENIKGMENSETSQEENLIIQPSDNPTDIINTVMNNSVLNEDETASSSYIPETPENQERDHDQDSAISTSSCEIPPCEELNITSSNISTSVSCEHSSIHNNGVLEIPTSPYTLNPDSNTSCVDEVTTSAYDDQIIIDPNVSTSYQVAISLPNFEQNNISSNNFSSNDSENKNESSSFYHSEMTDSYFESICKDSNQSRESKNDLIDKTTLHYYENNPHNINSTSQDYFNQEAATSFSSHDISSNYYDSQSESDVNQRYFSATVSKSDSLLVLSSQEEHQNFSKKKDDDDSET